MRAMITLGMQVHISMSKQNIFNTDALVLNADRPRLMFYMSTGASAQGRI